jgi:peptidoglycan hydrolase CwlO-like protein
MEQSRRTLRALAGAVVALVVAAAAPLTAGADDVTDVRERAQSAADDVSHLERELASLRSTQQELEERIAETNTRMARLELQRHQAGAVYEEALDRYVEVAIDVYKSGSGNGNLELILAAKSFTDVVALNHLASSAASVAQRRLGEMRLARRATEVLQDDADGYKQSLLADIEELDNVGADMETLLIQRRESFARLTEEIEALEAQARHDARVAEAAEVAEPDVSIERILSPGGPSPGIPDGFVGTGVTFEGEASWYGPGFEGNSTANGESFDPSGFTAASKVLPFNTWLFVQFEGRGVAVRINDRGPYVGDRILDLSQAAAAAIGLGGVGWITAEILVKE